MTKCYARTKATAAKLLALGVKPGNLYVEGVNGATLGGITMRQGERLGLFHGLREFGDSRKEIMIHVVRFHQAGCTLVDLTTGMQSLPGRGAEMLHVALKMIHGEQSGFDEDEAREAQKLSTKKKTEGRMLKKYARPIWKDKTKSNAEALALMIGWTERTAYNELKSRGVPRGVRKKSR